MKSKKFSIGGYKKGEYGYHYPLGKDEGRVYYSKNNGLPILTKKQRKVFVDGVVNYLNVFCSNKNIKGKIKNNENNRKNN